MERAKKKKFKKELKRKMFLHLGVCAVKFNSIFPKGILNMIKHAFKIKERRKTIKKWETISLSKIIKNIL